MSVARLHLRVEHHDLEPAYSLVARLAARHGCGSLKEFLSMLPTGQRPTVAQVRRGKSMDLIASLAGIDGGRLRFSTASIHGLQREVVLGHAVVGDGVTLQGRAAVCPVCIGEDLDTGRGPAAARPWHRAWWGLSMIHTCPVHRVLLERACRMCGTRFDRFRRPGLCQCGANVLGAGVPCDHPEADRLLISRVAGSVEDAPDPLPGTTLRKASTILTSIGRLKLDGHRGALLYDEARDPELLARAASTGLEILRARPDAFTGLLDSLVATAPHGCDPRLRYGRLYQLLVRDRHPALQGMREAVVEHARRSSVDSGATFLGHDTGGRVTISHRVAARLLGRGVVETARILGARGHPVRSLRARAWETDRRHVEEAGRWLARQVPEKAVVAELGLTRCHLDDLAAAGLLPASLPRARTEFALYDRQLVDSLVSRCRLDVPRTSVVPDGSMQFAQACTRLKSAAALVLRLADGRVRATGWLAGRGSLGGMCVSEESFMAARDAAREQEYRDSGLISTRQARKLLFFNDARALASAVSVGCLTLDRHKPRTGRPCMGVRPAEIDRFRDAYVTGAELLNRAPAGLSIVDLQARLKRAGIARVHSASRTVAIYDRNAAIAAARATGLWADGEGMDALAPSKGVDAVPAVPRPDGRRRPARTRGR